MNTKDIYNFKLGKYIQFSFTVLHVVHLLPCMLYVVFQVVPVTLLQLYVGSGSKSKWEKQTLKNIVPSTDHSAFIVLAGLNT